MDGVLLSIVIPTFNRRDSLLHCLRALAGQGEIESSCEVIVVVDGSTDGSAEAVQSVAWPFPLRIIRQANLGAGAARNAGASEAAGAWIAFVEDDVLPADTWVRSALDIVSGSPADVIEGRTAYAETLKQVRRFEAGRIPSFIPCNLIVRRESFEAVGGYSPEFFDRTKGLYFREDSDFGFRLLKAGYTVRLDERLLVLHPEQFTSLAACYRHVRRYVFDPLLYRRHPVEYRRMIEVKKVFGREVRRPLHYAALAAVPAMLLLAGGIAAGSIPAWGGGSLLLLAVSTLFRVRYKGRKALQLYRAGETAGFLGIPFVYLLSLLRGCLRYRTFGPVI